MPRQQQLTGAAGIGPASPLRGLEQSRMARVRCRLHRLLQVCNGGRAALHANLRVAKPIPKTPPTFRASCQICCETAGSESPRTASFPRPETVTRQRYERDATRYVVTMRGKFSGHLWLARGYYDEDGVRCRDQLPTQPASTLGLRRLHRTALPAEPRSAARVGIVKMALCQAMLSRAHSASLGHAACVPYWDHGDVRPVGRALRNFSAPGYTCFG